MQAAFHHENNPTFKPVNMDCSATRQQCSVWSARRTCCLCRLAMMKTMVH